MLSKIMLITNMILTCTCIAIILVCLLSEAFGWAWVFVPFVTFFILNTKAFTDLIVDDNEEDK